MSERQSDKPVVVIERSESGLGPFLLGIGIGAAVALLFAPRSGEDTRRDLTNRGRRLRAVAAEKAEELQDVLVGGYEDTKSRVEDGLATARQVIDDKTDGAKEALGVGKAAVHSAREELKKQLSDARATRAKRRPRRETEPEPEPDELEEPDEE